MTPARILCPPTRLNPAATAERTPIKRAAAEPGDDVRESDPAAIMLEFS